MKYRTIPTYIGSALTIEKHRSREYLQSLLTNVNFKKFEMICVHDQEGINLILEGVYWTDPHRPRA